MYPYYQNYLNGTVAAMYENANIWAQWAYYNQLQLNQNVAYGLYGLSQLNQQSWNNIFYAFANGL